MRAYKFLVQPRVNAAGTDERIVRPAFDNPALIENEEEVRFANRAKAMRDYESGAAAKEKFERALQARFSHAVNGAGGFVEDDKPGIGQEYARKADQLALAEGKRGAFLADLRIEALREGF